MKRAARLLNSRVTGNSANAVAPFGRFVQGGAIYADRDATLSIEDSNIDGNSSNLTSSIPHPFPLQDGGTDQSNAWSGGIFLNSSTPFSRLARSNAGTSYSSPSAEPLA